MFTGNDHTVLDVCVCRKRREHSCTNGRYTSSFSPIILILFRCCCCRRCFHRQILYPILAAINDKCYDTIKPSRLHITSTIKAMILSTTSIRCALVIVATAAVSATSASTARARVPRTSTPSLLVYVVVGVRVRALASNPNMNSERTASRTHRQLRSHRRRFRDEHSFYWFWTFLRFHSPNNRNKFWNCATTFACTK